jgi:hypothetical protein
VGQDGQKPWYLGHGGRHVGSETSKVEIHKRYDWFRAREERDPSVQLRTSVQASFLSFLGNLDAEFGILTQNSTFDTELNIGMVEGQGARIWNLGFG